MRFVTAVLLALLCAPFAAARQDDPVQLRSDLVEVRAVVTDDKGRLVDDLRREDFEVLENGEPRPIEFFSVERAGDAASSTAPVSAGPATPREPGAAPAPTAPTAAPRTVLLFVDAANLSPSSLGRVKKQLAEFVERRLAPGDAAAVVASGNDTGLAAQFTADRALLRAAIEKLSPRRTSFSNAFTPYLAAEILRGSNPEALEVGVHIVRSEDDVPPPLDPAAAGGNAPNEMLPNAARRRAREVLAEAGEQRRITLAALRAAVERLSNAPGQRLLALVSDGFTLYDRGGERETAEMKTVIARAVRSGVVIYSLAGEGLESGVFDGPSDPFYPVPSHLLPGYTTASRRDLEDGMTALARDTGGEVFRNTNDLAGALSRMLDANRVYYVLAYYPPETAKKTGPRRIDVKLKTRSGLRVRAQRGTDAPEIAAGARPVVDALSAPFLASDLGVSVRADFARAGQAVVTVHVDADRLTFAAEGDTRAFNLEVATAILDERGNTIESKVEALDGRLGARAYELARANGFRVERSVTLEPGRYRVRAAVREVSTGRIGSDATKLDVPDLGAGRLALGGLLLTEARGEGPLALPRTVDGVRTFGAASALVYSATAFNVAAEAATEMRIAISRGETVVYRSAWEPVAARAVERREGSVRLSGQLGLGAIPAGAYTLRIEVRDTKRGQTAGQAAEFGVGKS